jgi:hypothetical protein
LDTPEDLRVAREALRAAYDDAFARLAQILFEEDPIGINFEDNVDEYEPEAGTILPRLRHCETVADIQGLLYLEFVRWFGAETAGPPECYRRAAERIHAEMVRLRMP